MVDGVSLVHGELVYNFNICYQMYDGREGYMYGVNRHQSSLFQRIHRRWEGNCQGNQGWIIEPCEAVGEPGCSDLDCQNLYAAVGPPRVVGNQC